MVKRKRKPLGKGAAQLEGALALFGGGIRVAGYDDAAFTARAGELIARSGANGTHARPQLPAKGKKNGAERR